MSDTLENPVINLKLLIDEEKYKVVFAESCKDFVDILFSFSTWPMGSIVPLMLKHYESQSTTIGCFNNIYASVLSIGMQHFRTKACKKMLLFPGSLSQKKYNKLKLNNIYNFETTKCFMCPMFGRSEQCSKEYSNFNTSRCSCGNFMDEVIQCQGEGSVGNGDGGGVFVRSDHTSFIITDDLKVEVKSVGLILNVLKDLGYTDCDKLVQISVDINLEEVVILWECLFTSDTPLTDAFLKRESSYDIMKRIHKTLSPKGGEDREESKAGQTIMLNAYVGKEEGNILFAECGEDFVDLLFTFLALPLESKQLLDDLVTTDKPPTYYRYVTFSVDHFREYCLSENSRKPLVYDWDKLVPLVSIDPKSEGNTSDESVTPTGGFMKRGTKFMVTDDLFITPSSSISTSGFLKQEQIRLDDVEVREIIIRKEEAIR
ncbi:unnamed protein product [Thlaspi arvense]|uniref:Uncharacterized protein n=1 Tax=Thlaspi arvense TaxID=13288 RepID=A0AAU9RNQ1_THLAR|nr:unnamed protein product [Thlaspi arvense]